MARNPALSSTAASLAAVKARIATAAAHSSGASARQSTNHTFFFREEHHFEHLATHVRPELLARANAGERLRIWSAGCSSGEEIWSVAMTLLGPDKSAAARLAQRDVLLLATDIADHVLVTAQAARYRLDALDAVPADLRRAWTRKDAGDAVMTEEARALVRFKSLNLLGDWPMKQAFDVIFCRNVMIYFDTAAKERLVHRFAQHLSPGAYLYIGHSERVTGPAAALLTQVGPTNYQREAA